LAARKTLDEHSQRALDREFEISYFHIALEKFTAKNIGGEIFRTPKDYDDRGYSFL